MLRVAWLSAVFGSRLAASPSAKLTLVTMSARLKGLPRVALRVMARLSPTGMLCTWQPLAQSSEASGKALRLRPATVGKATPKFRATEGPLLVIRAV